MHASAKKVQDFLEQCGFSCRVVEMLETTRSAREAAASIGCNVSQIAKSLMFRGRESGTAILVIASGSNRVNENVFVGHLG